jgi:hypothetical protein
MMVGTTALPITAVSKIVLPHRSTQTLTCARLSAFRHPNKLTCAKSTPYHQANEAIARTIAAMSCSL